MIFQNPQILFLLLLLLPAGYVLQSGRRKTERILDKLADASVGKPAHPLALQVLSLFLLASLLLVAAGPQRKLAMPDTAQSGKFVFLLDVSRSMAARASCDDKMQMDYAREFLKTIVTGLPAAEFAFAGFSELTFPFTELSFDKLYLQEVIDNGLFVESVPVPGSDIGNALLLIAEKKTIEPTVYAGVEHVLLVSDGDFSEEVSRKLSESFPVMKEAGIVVDSIGFGSVDGLPIPTLDAQRNCLEGRFERAEGKEFYTRLFEQPLRMIAEQSGGQYFAANEQQKLLSYLASSQHEATGLKLPPQAEDLSPIFLLLATLSLFGLVYLRRF